jgi:gas vesicle protein
MSDHRGKGELWAFVAGALAGGIAALLLAPAKGEDTRRKIASTAEDLYGKGEHLYHQGIEKAGDLYESGKAKAGEVKHKMEDAVDSLKGKHSEGKAK